MIDKVTLYRKNNRGQVSYWSIWSTKEGLEVKYGTLGGEPRFDNFPIKYGFAGRSWKEQIELKMQSKINKKLDGGYKKTIEEAEAGVGTNACGLFKPMLAKSLDLESLEKEIELKAPGKEYRKLGFNEIFLQKKYDGHRCLITRDQNGIKAYSRNGKPIISIPHILDSLLKVMKVGETLDGELYIHKTPLQEISSFVRKKQEESKNLFFVCYDFISNGNYFERYKELKRIFSFKSKLKTCILAPTIYMRGEFEIRPILKEAVQSGYEGLILRLNNKPYESGTRSSDLIKVKSWIDDEYIVEDISRDSNNRAILHMQHNGEKFKASAPGNVKEREYTANNSDDFIGKCVNIKYMNLTKDGVPFHPVANYWRDKDGE